MKPTEKDKNGCEKNKNHKTVNEKSHDEGKKSPLLCNDEMLFHILRICFHSGEMSPDLLSKATGVNIDLCIEFMSEAFAKVVCGQDET